MDISRLLMRRVLAKKRYRRLQIGLLLLYQQLRHPQTAALPYGVGEFGRLYHHRGFGGIPRQQRIKRRRLDIPTAVATPQVAPQVLIGQGRHSNLLYYPANATEPPAGIGISPLSLAELYDGILGDADPAHSEGELFAFLARGITTVEVDLETCRVFARERRRLRAAGNLIPDFDLMIGATAVRHNLTLLSNNRRHFQRIAGLNLISV